MERFLSFFNNRSSQEERNFRLSKRNRFKSEALHIYPGV